MRIGVEVDGGKKKKNMNSESWFMWEGWDSCGEFSQNVYALVFMGVVLDFFL